MQEKEGDESVSEEPTSVEATASLNINILPSTVGLAQEYTRTPCPNSKKQPNQGPLCRQHKPAVSGLVVLGTSLSHSAPNSRRHTSFGSV